MIYGVVHSDIQRTEIAFMKYQGNIQEVKDWLNCVKVEPVEIEGDNAITTEGGYDMKILTPGEFLFVRSNSDHLEVVNSQVFVRYVLNDQEPIHGNN